MSSFRYEIMEELGTVSMSADGTKTTEVNLIKFNDADPRIDIRHWDRENDRMLKGIVLSPEQARRVHRILGGYLEREGLLNDGETEEIC